MSDQPTSGNPWESQDRGATPYVAEEADRPLPPPVVGSGAPAPEAATPVTPVRRRRFSPTSLKLAAAGLVIFLGGGAGGYAVAHASQDPSREGTRAGVPGQAPFDRDGGLRGDRPDGDRSGPQDGTQDGAAPGSDTSDT